MKADTLHFAVRAARRSWPTGLILLGIALRLWASSRPIAVEHIYARRVYPLIAHVLGTLTGWAPISVAECALVLATLWLVRKALSGGIFLLKGKTSARAMLGHSLLGGLNISGAVYMAFLLVWGLLYAREPFRVSKSRRGPAKVEELVRLSEKLVERVDALRPGLPEREGVFRLEGGWPETLGRSARGFEEAALEYPLLRGPFARPKPVLLSPAMSLLGITGIYFPFTGEANVNIDAPEVEIPFATCHEMAHQRGFAREDEANYLGYLACRLHPDRDFQYSGAFVASQHALSALRGVDRGAFERLLSGYSAAVRRDLAFVAAWARRHEGGITRLQEKVNDTYLKSQGQAHGVQSYGRMVDLLIDEQRNAESRQDPQKGSATP